jgi:CheY-like chemotaxis protein
MNILIVEDDENKRDEIKKFISTSYPKASLLIAGSYHSAIERIERDHLDLLVLDMTIPTFDLSAEESGGSTRHFGGRDILRLMVRKGMHIPVVVVTQLDNFGESGSPVSLIQLIKDLGCDYKKIYLGTVYYNPAQAKWKTELAEYINKINKKGVL